MLPQAVDDRPTTGLTLREFAQRRGNPLRTPTWWRQVFKRPGKPIVRAMHREQVRRAPWNQCDDTTLDLQDPSRAPKILTGHLWVYRGERGEVVHDFTWARNRDGPLKMLADYRGYLQVDAPPAYDDVFAQHPGIIEVGCWAHSRRSFKDAQPTAPVVCAQILAISGPLYGIEHVASDRRLDAPARQRHRHAQARPILEALHAYRQEQSVTLLPKSPLGTAPGDVLRNWAALTRYAKDGHLKIDNNGAEQTLRQSASAQAAA